MLSNTSPPSSLKNPRYGRYGRRLSSHSYAQNPTPLSKLIDLKEQELLMPTLDITKSPALVPVSTTLPPVTPLELSMPILPMRSNSQVVFDDDEEDDDQLDYPMRFQDRKESNDENDVFGENIDV